MNKPNTTILHLLTATKHTSPFDVNMAIDAGFQQLPVYTNVALDEVKALTQDAIFSRQIDQLKCTALFIGGKDIEQALTMQGIAKASMLPPFEISTLVDPSGAFTTAGAVVAKIEQMLKTRFNEDIEDQKIAILGASGAVGRTVAILAGKEKMQINLIAHKALSSFQSQIDYDQNQFGLSCFLSIGMTEAEKRNALTEMDVIVCCGPPGVEIISANLIDELPRLKIILDVNAVPPLGVGGISVQYDGSRINSQRHAIGFGALSIGKLKYQIHHRLLKRLLRDDCVHLDMFGALKMGKEIIQADSTSVRLN